MTGNPTDNGEAMASLEDGAATEHETDKSAESDSTTEAAVPARVKKVQRRRDRITVVQNPSSYVPAGVPPKSPASEPNVKSIHSASTVSATKSPTGDRSLHGNISQSGSTTTVSTRQRVAGGAAAKIMLQGCSPTSPSEEESYDDESDSEDVADYTYATEELDHARRQARVEYDIGTGANKRYKPVVESLDESEYYDMESEASLPSILDRNEVFHENVSAAIVALLNPRGGRSVAESAVTGYSPGSGAGTSTVSPTRSAADTGTLSPSHSVAASISPRRSEKRSEASREVNAYSALDAPLEAIRKVPNQPLLNEKAEKKMELMKKKMINPSKTLAELLTAIAKPSEGEEMDKTYMVRRKNACGALKVLTTNAANRKTIGWTLGVLPALTSVLADGGEGNLEDAFPDARVRVEYIEARKRAVAALLNLALLKENRVPIFLCPGLMYALGQTILQDKEESRQGCCAVVGYLSKTSENRLLLIKIPGMLDAMTSAIKPRTKKPKKKPAKKYIWDTFDDSYSASTAERINSDNTDLTDRRSFNTEEEDFVSDDDYVSSPRYDDESNDESHDDSDMTPLMSTSPTSEASRRSFLYDNDSNTFVHATRQNVFATLLHVVKEKDNAVSIILWLKRTHQCCRSGQSYPVFFLCCVQYHLARHADLLFTLIDISYMQESPFHTYALKIIANLTRHRGNSKLLVFHHRVVVPALVQAMSSRSLESRTHAIHSLQNLSQDKSCRQDIAITQNLVDAIVQRVRLSSDMQEKLAAVTTLKNLADEPANLIPMTNTPDCFATLMQVANGGNEITEMMQFQACDALATLSHWLRKIASTGTLEQGSKEVPKASDLMNPTLRVVTWSQWT